MADHRNPEYRIAITGPDGRRVSELFPAALFPGGQGLAGRYRIRIDRAWYMPGGLKYAYLPLSEALAVAGWGRTHELPPPDLPRGSRVLVPTGRSGLGEGDRVVEATVTATEPFQGPDGRWRVFVVGMRTPVLVEGIEKRR